MWKGVLNDLVERGLNESLILVTDGNLALLKAAKGNYPFLKAVYIALFLFFRGLKI